MTINRRVVKLLLSFFQVKKQTEQRYREQDNESISIQWQFQVKPYFAQTCEVFPQFETLSRPRTHTDRSCIHTFIQPGSPDVLNWRDNRIRCKHSGQNQCLGLMSTIIFTKCNYQTCFIVGQKMQSFQFKTMLEAMFHKIWT